MDKASGIHAPLFKGHCVSSSLPPQIRPEIRKQPGKAGRALVHCNPYSCNPATVHTTNPATQHPHTRMHAYLRILTLKIGTDLATAVLVKQKILHSWLNSV